MSRCEMLQRGERLVDNNSHTLGQIAPDKNPKKGALGGSVLPLTLLLDGIARRWR
jgi:hypothetical protein